MGFPLLRKDATFNEYYFTVIVGLGFGVYNTYIIDHNITSKLSLGFVRREDKIYKKEHLFLCETIKFVIENLRFYIKFNFKNTFTAALIFWNLCNFLINLLSQLRILKKNTHDLTQYYEEYLKQSIWVLCEAIKNSEEENLLILQAIEITDRIAILYKMHMNVIFDKKADALSIKDFEMNGRKTKYFFQKHLYNYFEDPEKFKEDLKIQNEKVQLQPFGEEIEFNYDIKQTIQQYGNLY